MTEFKIDAIQEEEIVGFLEKDRDAVAAVKEENAITNQPKKNDIRTKADQYFKEIQLQTRRTWSEKISPDAVKRFLGTTRYGRMWMFFQVKLLDPNFLCAHSINQSFFLKKL